MATTDNVGIVAAVWGLAFKPGTDDVREATSLVVAEELIKRGAKINAYDAKAIEEFGMALDYSGKGRLKKLSRLLIEEYVERFYPGIASEHPENDWICIEAYLDQMHPGWRAQVGVSPAGDADADGKVTGKVRSSKPKRKVRNNFRLY